MENATRQGPSWMRISAVALLGGFALCLLSTLALRSTAAPAAGPAAPQAGRNVEVHAGQLGRDIYGLYLVDHNYGTICVYQYDPRERKLKLTAVRRYSFDVQLNEAKPRETAPREK